MGSCFGNYIFYKILYKVKKKVKSKLGDKFCRVNSGHALRILPCGFWCHAATLDETVPMRSAVRGILGNI